LDYVEPCTFGSEMKDKFSVVSTPYQQVMSSEAAMLEVLANTRKHGFAFMTGTPLDKDLTQQLIERIAPIQHTIYGGFWETVVKSRDEADNIDSAYSSVALPAHTDGNYFVDPPGLQIFHCLQPDAKGGGESLLVDGFRVAENVKRRDLAAFEMLARHKVTYQHLDGTHHLRAKHHTIGLDGGGRLESIHFNNLDRDTLLLPLDQTEQFYDAWRVFSKEVQNPSNEVWYKLTPGDVVIIDNCRVMHGRSAFDIGSGRRLVGCYVSTQDFHGRYRVLKAKKDAGTLS